MPRWVKAMVVVQVCLALTGCSLGRPNWGHPGPTAYQQHRATLFDPYADNDAGPEVVGARPPDFQKPLAEPVRSRAMRDSWGY